MADKSSSKEIKAPAPEIQVPCTDCNGTGLQGEILCPTCAGSGSVTK